MKNKFFNTMCSIFLACFIVMIFTPFITLAIPTTQTIPVTTSISPPEPEVTETASENSTSAKDITTNQSSDPEYDTYTYTERQQNNMPTILPPTELYYGTKTIYLTFDDGPDPENTARVLDILKENNIKATFFVLGTQVQNHPTMLKRIYEEGHAIGNHSYNHIYRELYQSPDTYLEQLHHNDDIIKNVLNVRPHISRAPGGSAGTFTKTYWDLLQNQGYIEVGWNISSGDASSAKADELVSNIIQQTNKNTFLWSHAILLMHDSGGHEETVKALPSIIKFYKEQGFEFRIINSKTPPAW